jgi:hypothetical protein
MPSEDSTIQKKEIKPLFHVELFRSLWGEPHSVRLMHDKMWEDTIGQAATLKAGYFCSKFYTYKAPEIWSGILKKLGRLAKRG